MFFAYLISCISSPLSGQKMSEEAPVIRPQTWGGCWDNIDRDVIMCLFLKSKNLACFQLIINPAESNQRFKIDSWSSLNNKGSQFNTKTGWPVARIIWPGRISYDCLRYDISVRQLYNIKWLSYPLLQAGTVLIWP